MHFTLSRKAHITISLVSFHFIIEYFLWVESFVFKWWTDSELCKLN